ncbi:PAS domain-containing sensor histidine kinase [Nocardioides acrostichi]|uniref:histidine kinase n=1 Tax=Nocardioides acrostichi TaxID=2784339 RepID=A0A930YDU4_9ACTN|nr:PAS domain S-box protein [Nocardioides acrostichi]MBF4162804.1 PAS domain S-box protein [Nocardioides acrostichi]
MDNSLDLGAGLWAGIFEASPDAIVVVDESGLIVAANRKCEHVFLREPAMLVGTSVDALVPSAVRRGHPSRRESYSAVHEGREMGLLELAAARADGTEFPAEISLASIRADGRTYTCATVRDITRRVRERERFRGLLEAAPDAMVIVDDQARIQLANRQVTNLFGYEASELVGQPIEILVPQRYRGHHVALRDGFLGHPGVRPMGSEQLLYAVRKDGTEFPVEISLSPLETAEGVLVSAAVRDVTERLRFQQQADRVRDELVATVSHELRTPLTSIIGYLELLGDLEGDSLSETGRSMLDVIERNAMRELRLVNDLLDLASLDNGLGSASLSQVSLGALAQASVRAVNEAILGADREVEFFLGDDVVVRGDAERLTQVFDNLLTNAFRFSDETSPVRVTGGRDGGWVWFEVIDAGRGIPEHELPHVFDRLFRGADAVRDQVPGAGLGLTITRAIIESHGGRIAATSIPDEGTTVRVELPRSTTEPSAAALASGPLSEDPDAQHA